MSDCGNIGIDCEWCENKMKCLLKEFYKEKQGLSTEERIKNYWEDEVNKLVDAFSEKIINKDYTVTHLPDDPNSDSFICISIYYVVSNKIAKIKNESEGLKTYIEYEYRPNDFFKKVKKLLQNKFDFKQISIYAYYDPILDLNNTALPNMYFLYFRV